MKRVEDNLGSLGNVKVLFCARHIVSFVIMLSYLLVNFCCSTVSCGAQLSNGASEYLQSSISQPTTYRGGNIFSLRNYLHKCKELLVRALRKILIKGLRESFSL